jgi:hypothetical protein
MKLAGNVAVMGSGELHAEILWRNPREIDHLEYQSIDGKEILRWMIKK